MIPIVASIIAMMMKWCIDWFAKTTRLLVTDGFGKNSNLIQYVFKHMRTHNEDGGKIFNVRQRIWIDLDDEEKKFLVCTVHCFIYTSSYTLYIHHIYVEYTL